MLMINYIILGVVVVLALVIIRFILNPKDYILIYISPL